jgi:hypothetical protein
MGIEKTKSLTAWSLRNARLFPEAGKGTPDECEDWYFRMAL